MAEPDKKVWGGRNQNKLKSIIKLIQPRKVIKDLDFGYCS